MSKHVLFCFIFYSQFLISQSTRKTVYVDFVHFPMSKDSLEFDAISGYYDLDTPVELPSLNGFKIITPATISKEKYLPIGSMYSEFNLAPKIQLPRTTQLTIDCSVVEEFLRDKYNNENLSLFHWSKVELDSILHSSPYSLEKKTSNLFYNFESAEDSLSVTNVFDGPLNTPVYGVIDVQLHCSEEVFSPKAYKLEIDSINNLHNKLMESKYDSIISTRLKPFYISKTEVTNGEFQVFQHYVRDSIFLYTTYQNADEESAFKLLNCSKKELKSLDLSNKEENLNKFGLRNPERNFSDFINNPDYMPFQAELYFPQPQRYYKRREIDGSKMNYKLHDSTVVNVTLDTLNFLKINCSKTDTWANMYGWHPAYWNYPVLNISYEQAQAYCVWKTSMLNKDISADQKKLVVKIPEIYHFELALKAEFPDGNGVILDHPNTFYITNERNECDIKFSENAFLFLTKVYAQRILSSKERAKLSNEVKFAHFLYEAWHFGNQTGDLRFINGNASEYASTKVDSAILQYYEIPYPEGDLNDYVFQLGSNYFQDVKTISGTQINAIFYKNIVKKDESHFTSGFRVVIIEE